MAKVRIPFRLDFGGRLLLRSQNTDDRHAGECAPCAYFDTYARMYGHDVYSSRACAEHIRRDHEPVG